MSDKHDIEVVRPSSPKEVAEAVLQAAQNKEVLSVAGNNTRSGLGNPVQAKKRIEIGDVNDLVFYEPKDLVIRAHAGMTIDEVKGLLDKEGQYLPFEPPRYASLYGKDPSKCTIGGAVATALSGPRRVLTGGVRDYVLGIEAVNGQGELYKAGGRTMKNVTGYDVSKLLTGSYGTLSVLTEVTLKLLPAPRAQLTLIVSGADVEDDVKLCVQLRSHPWGISGLTHMKASDGTPRLYIRLEGSEIGVKLHADDVKKLIAQRGDVQTLQGQESIQFWQDVRELKPLAASDDELIWRVNISVKETAGFVKAAKDRGCLNNYFIDWGGNVIYLTMRSSQPEVDVLHLRDLATKVGAHATMLRAPDAIRRQYGAFPALADPVKRLALRTKSALDPLNILNTGRMVVQK